MPTQDETPTLDAQPDNTLDIQSIIRELEVWHARHVLVRNGALASASPEYQLYTVATCTEALDKWLDILSDALFEQQFARS